MFETNPFFNESAGSVARPAGSDFDLVLYVVIAAFVVFGVVVFLQSMLSGDDGPRRHRSRRSSRPLGPIEGYKRPDWARELSYTSDTPLNLRDPADQMKAISRTGFETKPLLNRSEARLLPALEKVVRQLGHGHRLMAQTCLGEILQPTGKGVTDKELDDAFYSINAKRLDFAVFNRFGYLVAAIEYQGHAHYHTESFMRDSLKREVMRKAGVPFLEIHADATPDEAARMLSDVLKPQSAPEKARPQP